jgi:hypothetical protein
MRGSLLCALAVVAVALAGAPVAAQDDTPTPGEWTGAGLSTTPAPTPTPTPTVTPSPTPTATATPTGTPTATPSSGAATPAARSTPEPGANAQRLTQGLRVVRATYDEDAGTATVVFHVEDPQQVVVTDAGGVWDGGRINQVRKVLPSGQSRIRLPVTEVEGDVAVTVGTESGLYGVPIEEQSYIFTRPATWQDAQLAGLAGLTGGLAAAAGLAYRRKNGGKKDWEREL